MTKKGKDFEADYFIREDIIAKHRLNKEQERKKHEKEEQTLKEIHHMKCPKCGHDLISKRLSYIDIDQCINCGAIVLAQEDIDGFLTEEKSILKSLVDFFK